MKSNNVVAGLGVEPNNVATVVLLAALGVLVVAQILAGRDTADFLVRFYCHAAVWGVVAAGCAKSIEHGERFFAYLMLMAAAGEYVAAWFQRFGLVPQIHELLP